MLFLSTVTFLVFILLQVPFSLVLSLIIGNIDAIPGIGATLGIGTVFLFLLTQNVLLAFKVLVASIILQQIQDNLVSPRVMQNSVDVNPVVTIFCFISRSKDCRAARDFPCCSNCWFNCQFIKN